MKLGIQQEGLKHGIPREAWCIPLVKNVWEYLNGQETEPDYFQEPFHQMADWWKQRWLLPRSERIHDWQELRKESVLESITTSR